MRTLLIAGLAMVTASSAAAERIAPPPAPPAPPPPPAAHAPMPAPMAGGMHHGMPGNPGPIQPGRPIPHGNMGPGPMAPHGQWHGGGSWHQGGGQHWQGGGVQQHRWGGVVNGRWSGGWNAPGGWGAYHRPTRGWRLPSYWIAPTFFIDDWAGYGLSAPPAGYRWSRYYDDAVLVDDSGQVWDSVGGVNWGDGYDYGYDQGYRTEYRQDYGAGYPPPPGAPYPDGRRGPPPPAVRVIEVPPMTQGYTTVYSGGYAYAPGTTVITIQSQPVVTTTTTTEYVTERVATRRWVAPKRHWRPAPKPRCVCRKAPPRILGS